MSNEIPPVFFHLKGSWKKFSIFLNTYLFKLTGDEFTLIYLEKKLGISGYNPNVSYTNKTRQRNDHVYKDKPERITTKIYRKEL